MFVLVCNLIHVFHFRYNVLDEEEIQGEEDGVSGMDGDVKVSIATEICKSFLFRLTKYCWFLFVVDNAVQHERRAGRGSF